MKGKLTIEFCDHGFAIDFDADQVQLEDKFELLHATARALDMSHLEMFLYGQLEQAGVFDEASKVQGCETNEELEHAMQVHQQSNHNAHDDELKSLMSELLQKLGGMV